MAESTDLTLFEQVVHRIDPRARLSRHWTLTGGVSAQVTALEITLPDGQTRNIIVRQHGTLDLQQNPHIAADEFALLHIVKAPGLPVPTPYFFDESGAIFPTPFIVVEYMDGAPEFAPADLPDFVRQLATTLAQIHRVNPASVDLSFLPQQAALCADKLNNRPLVLDDSLDEGQIRDALESIWPLPHVNEPALLHGDFWPGNILWKAGQLRAVIDWEDARVGDPLADLGNARLELLWAFGDDAMRDFTRQYQSAMPGLDYANLSCWDLWAALRPAGRLGTWALNPAAEARMRERHKTFVAQAVEQLRKYGL